MLLAPASAAAATIPVPAGGDLQAAIDAAQPGDTIELEAGATFVGNFVLQVKPGATYIVIRTAPDPLHPLPGDRVTPDHATRLAKIRSPNTDAAIMTAPGAHHWRLELLEIGPTRNGYGEVVRLGKGGVDQNTLAKVPYEIVIDRCYIHGDPLLGQKRGVAVNSAATTVINSYISDIKTVGQDTQAICGWNGPGPFVIENNYLEGAGENVMFGGADPHIAGLVPSDITFRGNHLSKPRTWQQPIIPTPVASATASGSGALAAGTYAYRVVARRHVGQGHIGTSAPSVEVRASLTTTGAVRISWPSVEHATEYRVYGRTLGSQTQYWTTTATSFLDTGASGVAGTPPAGGTRWTVKNLFELKNARRVTAEGNVFENVWRDAQVGVAIAFTPRNDGGTSTWSEVSDVTFRYNLIRHAGGAINVNGYDTIHPSGPGRNFLIQHNLAYDIRWGDGSPGRFLTMGNGPSNVVVDHNTSIQESTLVFVYARNSDGTFDVVPGFRFSNNLGLHNEYGIMGESSGGYGNISILTYFFDLASVTYNVMAGGPASMYPADNWFPTVDAFMAEFADDSYRLRPDSAYRNAGTDGLDLGADVEEIWARADRAIRGTASSNAAPVAAPGGPYTGSTLTPITFDGTASVDPDGTIVSYVWNWSDGSAESYGPVATHTFVSAGTYTVTLTVVDDAGASGTGSVVVTVVESGLPSDLVITALKAPLRAAAGGTIAVFDSTTNQGTGVGGPSVTAFYLSRNSLLDASDIRLGAGRAIPSLAPGSSSSGTTGLLVPGDITPGAWYLLVAADAEGAVSEIQENNNLRSVFLLVGPDLQMTSIGGVGPSTAGGVVTVTDTVANRGAGTAGASRVTYYLSVNVILDGADQLLAGARNVPPLAAGASSSGSTPVTIPAGTAPGNYFILAVADGDNEVAESSETNNTTARGIQIE